MNSIKIATVAAIFAVSMSGAAFALDAAGKANTRDPNSAPVARDVRTNGISNDAAARANTSDPNSAPLKRDAKRRGVANDAAARANTRDPNSATTGSR